MKIRKLTLLTFLLTTLAINAQIFYRIEGNGLPAPSYLFGTHHLAPLSILDSLGVRQVLAECSQVVGELDMTTGQMAIAMEMQPHMMAPADSTLSKVLGPEGMARYSSIFSQYAPMAGMELQSLDMLKPMAVNSMVSVNIVSRDMPGFDPAQQLDTWFQQQAKADGKKVIGLETAGQQAAFLFDSVSIADQAKSLCQLLDDPEQAISLGRQINRAYMARDLDAMYQISKAEDADPQAFEYLLFQRNDNWMDRLPAILNQGSTFIAVGALHLPGPRGLIEQLRKAGYTVQEMK